jgi:hypothetical protein
MSAILQHFLADGVTAVTGVQLSNILAGLTGTPLKFGVKNVGDRAQGNAFDPTKNFTAFQDSIPGNDGITRFRSAADASGTIAPPFNFAAVLGATADGGVWGATGTYGWVIVSVNGAGVTGASDEVTVQVDDTTKRVTLTWDQVTGATGYRIYRTPTPGTYGASTLLTTIGSGATVTFVDDGTATVAGTPPLTNTTGGAGPAFGTPPAGLNTATAPFLLGQSPGTLEMGETAFYWVNRVVPSNSTPAGNPRATAMRFREL